MEHIILQFCGEYWIQLFVSDKDLQEINIPVLSIHKDKFILLSSWCELELNIKKELIEHVKVIENNNIIVVLKEGIKLNKEMFDALSSLCINYSIHAENGYDDEEETYNMVLEIEIK